MNEKTRQLLLYLIKNNPRSSITSLMKLAYLVDLINIKRTNRSVSNFEYKRHFYGPFDKKLYTYVEDFISDKLVISESDYGSTGEEFSVFLINGKVVEDLQFDKLSKDEISVIDELLASVRGYGAKALTEIAYKTKPMVKLRATIGGSEHLGERLNLQL